MRIVVLATAAAWVIAAQAPAQAAECTRGMLWPYVRATGDCLTPAEVSGGMKGTYSGPVNTNPDVASLPAAPPANAIAPPSSGGGGTLLGVLGLSSGSSSPSAPSPYSYARIPGPPEVACRKGILWPFVRDPGDCLTDQEKMQPNVGGVFRGERLASLPAAAGTNTVASVPSAATPIPAAPAAPNAANCRKGALWPFVRSPGDCLTDAEKVQQGKDAVYRQDQLPARPAAPAPAVVAQAPQAAQTSQAPQTPPVLRPAIAAPAAAPAVSAPPANPVAMRTAAAAACNKDLFWPFVRKTGDCLTDAEKRNPNNDGYFHANGNDPVPMATVSGPAIVPAATLASATPAAGAACNKGLFWPFVRKTGDCLTDAEKRNPNNDGYFHADRDEAVATAAPAPAAAPVVPAAARPAAPAAPTVAATPAARAVACHKGLTWPFLRETGDCLTDAEKRNPNNDGIFHAADDTGAAAAPPSAAPAAVVPAAARPAAAAATPAVATPASQAATCHKGLAWPFLRATGDCLTDLEKRNPNNDGIYHAD